MSQLKKTDACLIHISNTYATKNQLQKIALEKVKEFNHVWFNTKKEAKKLLEDLIQKSVSECRTKCRPISWIEWTGVDPDTLLMRLMSDNGAFIYLSLLPVYTIDSQLTNQQK